jgi:DNA-binding IclR family transcriptional regulator
MRELVTAMHSTSNAAARDSSNDPKNGMIQSLRRGIAVVRALARVESASVAELAAGVQLNRGTVYRLLNTLVANGTVKRDAVSGRYAVGPRAQSFAWGFDREDRLEADASAILSRAGRDLRWALALCEAIGPELVLRATTDHETSLIMNRRNAGDRFPLTFPAAGWTILAFSPGHVRDALIDLTETLPLKPYHRIWETRAALLAELSRIARRGYALKHQVYTDNTQRTAQTAALSVPIRNAAGDVYGALSVRYFLKTLSDEQAIATLCPTLKKTADEIAAVYQRCRC